MQYIKKIFARIISHFLLGRISPYNGIKTTVILQQTETECGLTALAILFSFYDFNIPLDELRNQCGVSRDGTKALTLIKIAEHYGFKAEAFSMDVTAVCHLHEPVIAFWNFNHFVVINGVGRDKFFINDPGYGNHAIGLTEFDKAFTGIVIRLLPTKDTPHIKKSYHYQTLLHKWLHLFYKEIIFLIACSFVLACLAVLNSALINIMIDQWQFVSRSLLWLTWVIVFSLMICFLNLGTTLRTKWVEFRLTIKASLRKFSQTILHLLQLPLMYFALRQKSEIIAIISQIDHVMDIMHRSISTLLGRSIILFIMLIIMSKCNLKLCCISLIVSGLSFTIFSTLNKVKDVYEKANLNLLGKHYANSLSWMRNIETIHACGLSQNVLAKWHSLLTRKMHVTNQINLFNGWLNLIFVTCNQTVNLLVLFIGGLDVLYGVYSIGNLMAFCSMNTFFIANIIALLQSAKNYTSGYNLYSRIDDLSKNTIDKRYLNTPNHQRVSRHDLITCHNINFYYNKTTKPVIENVSLKIHRGEHIGIVGGTGSGKSTLAKLLCALYHPDTGEIRIGEQNLANYSAAELCRTFAYVSQDVSLFAGTIYANLTIGNDNADLQIINNALQIACIDKLVKQRNLYSLVSESGHNFSGGEKQRLDIARALIQNTPILILDEATSALDLETETQLIYNLRTTAKTIIFIAHRLTTVEHCDQIIVLNQGKINEKGKHRELLQNNSCYANLVRLNDSVLRNANV